MKFYINTATGAALLSAASSFLTAEARVGQAHEVQRKDGFPEQAQLQTSLGFPEVNCNIKFPGDAKLEYLSSGAEKVELANCEFHGNMLINDAPSGIQVGSAEEIEGKMWCKFKVTFSDGNDCICEVTTKQLGAYFTIDHDGCECMRIKRCEGRACPGDGNTGQWPCDKEKALASYLAISREHDGCKRVPQVTLTVESSRK